MISISKSQARLKSKWDATLARHKTNMVEAKPVLNDIITIITEEWARDDGMTPVDKIAGIRIMSDFRDFINTLVIDDAKPADKKVYPKLSNPLDSEKK